MGNGTHQYDTQTRTIDGITESRYVCTCGAETAWEAVSGDAWESFTGFPPCGAFAPETESEPDTKVLTYELRNEITMLCLYRIDYCEGMAQRTAEIAAEFPTYQVTVDYWNHQMEKARKLREFLDGISRDMIEKPF